eukprot:m51a1_g14021 hypothetical protein (441) ;mRNA; r:1108649-1110900
MMDTPLLGERTGGVKAGIVVLGGLSVVFSLFSVAAGLALGVIDKRPGHVILVITMAMIAAILGLLWRWYNDKEDNLAPKFRYLLILIFATLMLTGVCINVYAWTNRPVAPKPPKPGPVCDGLYDLSTNSCYGVPPGNKAARCKPPFCMFLIAPGTACCANCTWTAERRLGEESPLLLLPEHCFDLVVSLAFSHSTVQLGEQDRHIVIPPPEGAPEGEEKAGEPWTAEFWLEVTRDTPLAVSVPLAWSCGRQRQQHSTVALKLLQYNDSQQRVGVSQFGRSDVSFELRLRSGDRAYLAFVHDGSTVALYRDGARVAGSFAPTSPLLQPSGHIGTLPEGCQVYRRARTPGEWGEEALFVRLREAAVWGCARAPAEIEQTFRDGGCPREASARREWHYVFDPRFVSRQPGRKGTLRVYDQSGHGRHGVIGDTAKCAAPVIVDW